MQKIFAQILLLFFQSNVQTASPSVYIKIYSTIVKNQGVWIPKYRLPNISNKSIHARVTCLQFFMYKLNSTR